MGRITPAAVNPGLCRQCLHSGFRSWIPRWQYSPPFNLDSPILDSKTGASLWRKFVHCRLHLAKGTDQIQRQGTLLGNYYVLPNEPEQVSTEPNVLPTATDFPPVGLGTPMPPRALGNNPAVTGNSVPQALRNHAGCVSITW